MCPVITHPNRETPSYLCWWSCTRGSRWLGRFFFL